MIYLKCSMRTLKRRIALRGRPEEQAIPTSYLKRLQDLYDAWFSRYKLSETIVIETDKLDYLHDLVHRLDLFARIEKVLGVRAEARGAPLVASAGPGDMSERT
jgi:deoxyadenosine/deoxycytidine kinase